MYIVCYAPFTMAETVTVDTLRAEVDVLNTELLKYELLGRGIQPATSMSNKKKQLLDALVEEQINGNVAEFSCPIGIQVDLRKCSDLVSSFSSKFKDTVKTEYIIDSYSVIIKYLEQRFRRIKPTNDDDQAEFDALGINIELLKSEIFNTSIINPNHIAPRNEAAHSSTMIDREHTSQNNQEHSANEVNNVSQALGQMLLQHNGSGRFAYPLHKWNVFFKGTEDPIGVLEFIERVKNMAQSRNVSNEQLFKSASELFADNGLKWFRTQNFQNWIDIERKLISDFVSTDFYDDLLDDIKKRKQRENETIVLFFAIIEDMFNKLPVEMGQRNKVKIVKKLLLPVYIPHIISKPFDNISELKSECKTLERGFLMAETIKKPTQSKPSEQYNRFRYPSSDRQNSNPFKRYPSNDRNYNRSGYSSQPNRNWNNNRSYSNDWNASSYTHGNQNTQFNVNNRSRRDDFDNSRDRSLSKESQSGNGQRNDRSVNFQPTNNGTETKFRRTPTPVDINRQTSQENWREASSRDQKKFQQ